MLQRTSIWQSIGSLSVELRIEAFTYLVVGDIDLGNHLERSNFFVG